MKHKLQYFCKFCRKPGEVEYDDSNPLSEEQVATWLKFVACDSCAVYYRTTRDMTRRLYAVCNDWFGVINTPHDDLDARNAVRNKLNKILTRLADAAAKFKHVQAPETASHVETLVDNPRKAGIVLHQLLN